MSTAADVIVVRIPGRLTQVYRGSGSQWRRIAEVLHGEIRDGKYPVGQKLPPMRSLASTYSAGHGTIQRAVEWLISIGVVEAHQGSGVTVVSSTGTEPRTVADVLDDHEERIASLEAEVRRLRGERRG